MGFRESGAPHEGSRPEHWPDAAALSRAMTDHNLAGGRVSPPASAGNPSELMAAAILSGEYDPLRPRSVQEAGSELGKMVGEKIEHFTWSAAREVGFHVLDAVFPSAGHAARLVVEGWKVVHATQSLIEHHGVRLGISIRNQYGFAIDLTLPFGGAGAMVPSVDPAFHLPTADSPTAEVSLELGASPHEAHPAAAQPDVQLYNFELPEPAPRTTVRVGRFDWPATATVTARSVTTLGMTAPVADVLSEPTVLTADAVASHAARLGVIERDDAVGWYLKKRRAKGQHRTRTRRRVRLITYVDPDSGFIGTVELAEDGRARFAYLVLKPEVLEAAGVVSAQRDRPNQSPAQPELRGRLEPPPPTVMGRYHPRPPEARSEFQTDTDL
jgi:hypothetical protein